MPPTIRSNFPVVAKAIQGIAGAFNFNAKGRYRTLGTDILDAVAQAEYDQTVLAQRQPDGQPLAPLKDSTRRRKERAGQSSQILVATGKMLALEQLRGTRTIGGRVASVVYGTDEEERQKAEWATEGSRRGRSRRRKRPFIGLNSRAERDIDLIIAVGLQTMIRTLGG